MDFDAARLFIRLYVALLMSFHGANKVLHGIAPIVDLVTRAGLPPWVAYGVYLGEIVGPILLLTGLWARLGALLVIVNILACVGLSHMGALFSLTPLGGWALELDAAYVFPCLIILLAGGGRHSLAGGGSKPMRVA